MQALQVAVVAGIGASVSSVIRHLQKSHSQIHLVRAGFAASHVQLQAHILKFFIRFFQLCFFSGQLFAAHLKIICHSAHTPLSYFLGSHCVWAAFFHTPLPESVFALLFHCNPDSHILLHFGRRNKSDAAKKPRQKQKAFSGACTSLLWAEPQLREAWFL